MRWRSATAECVRNSRTHRLRNELRREDDDRLLVCRAISRMLHPIAAMFRCRLHSWGELLRAFRTRRRTRSAVLESIHRDRECDESRCGAPRARGSWTESRRLSEEYSFDNKNDSPPNRAMHRAKAGLHSSKRETDVCRGKGARQLHAAFRQMFRDPKAECS